MDVRSMAMVLGFAGGLAVLASFAGVAAGRLRAEAVAYHALNLAGALALIASGTVVRAWPSVAVNVVWALISAAGLAGTSASWRVRIRPRRGSTAPS